MRRYNKQREAEELQIISAVVFYQQIPESCRVQQVACTEHNSFLLSNSGQVFSWGKVTNTLGRKVPHERDAARPGLVERLRDKFIQSIATGDSHVLALSVTTNFAASASTSVDPIFSWGSNEFGQLGIGNTISQIYPETIPALPQIAKINCGPQSSFAVTSTGELYVWGSNAESQLGLPMSVPSKSKPTKVTVPWKNFNELEVLNDFRNKTFYYRSIMDQEITPDGVNRKEFEQVISENANLTRRLQTEIKRMQKLEHELYQHEDVSSSSASDTLLKQFTELHEEAKQEIREIELSLEEEEKSYKELRVKSKSLVKEIKEIENGFLKMKIDLQQCEHQVKELAVQQEMSTSESSTSLRTKKERLSKLEIEINEQAKVRADKHSELSDNENRVLRAIDQIDEYKADLVKKKHTLKVYEDIINTRKEQLKQEYLENNQKAVERDILSLVMINETIEDTALANLSKSMPPTGLVNLTDTSRGIMERIASEIETMKKPSHLPMFELLNEVWAIVSQNLKLRQELNELTVGLSIKLAESFSEYYTDEVRDICPMRMFTEHLDDSELVEVADLNPEEIALIGVPLEETLGGGDNEDEETLR
jgi:hypothetical protein